MQVVISLHTELAWGRPSDDKRQALFEDETAGRNAIEYILNVFEKYRIPGTWAIVGHLLLDECSTETHHHAEYIDSFDPYTDHKTDPLYYAPDILDRLKQTSVNHEIAGHSFTHPDFADLSREDARQELEEMTAVFSDQDIEINSFVFPGNMLAHLDLLPKNGIEAYSAGGAFSNYTLREGIMPFLRRDPSIFDAPPVEVQRDNNDLLAIPSSRNLRDERWGWLNTRRVKRAISSDKDGIIHLTLHPHNVIYDSHLRRTLPKICRLLDEKRDAGDVKIRTFQELSESE